MTDEYFIVLNSEILNCRIDNFVKKLASDNLHVWMCITYV